MVTLLKKHLDAKSAKHYQKLTNLVSSFKNYQFYRDTLTTVTNNKVASPILPYSALYLKDITFIEDGNLDILDENKVNTAKISMLASYLVQLLHFQKHKFMFKKDMNMRAQILHNVVILSEEEQYELSKKSQGTKFKVCQVQNELN